jgi:nucleoid-associated protein YgaU
MKGIKRIAQPLLLILSAFLAIALCAHAQAAEQTVTHIVRPGETLQTISKKYYGTTRKWSEIYGRNRSVLNSPQSVAPGMKLKLHVSKDSKLAERAQKANLARTPAQVRVETLATETPSRVVAPAGLTPQSGGITAAAPTSFEEPAKIATEPLSAPIAHAPTAFGSKREGLIQIRVREGDTLEGLAEKHMGSAKFWPRIVELNSTILHGPDDLSPGQLIQIQELLPHPTEALVKPADQFSAIEIAATDSNGARDSNAEHVAAPAPVGSEPSRKDGLPHYDEFIDP